MPMEILIQTLRCIGNLLIFLAICLIVLIPARKLLKIPSYLIASVLVSLYMIRCGIKTILENVIRKK